jgi:hypothetical protein
MLKFSHSGCYKAVRLPQTYTTLFVSLSRFSIEVILRALGGHRC